MGRLLPGCQRRLNFDPLSRGHRQCRGDETRRSQARDVDVVAGPQARQFPVVRLASAVRSSVSWRRCSARARRASGLIDREPHRRQPLLSAGDAGDRDRIKQSVLLCPGRPDRSCEVNDGGTSTTSTVPASTRRAAAPRSLLPDPSMPTRSTRLARASSPRPRSPPRCSPHPEWRPATRRHLSRQQPFFVGVDACHESSPASVTGCAQPRPRAQHVHLRTDPTALLSSVNRRSLETSPAGSHRQSHSHDRLGRKR